jgi:hypothetical protein
MVMQPKLLSLFHYGLYTYRDFYKRRRSQWFWSLLQFRNLLYTEDKDSLDECSACRKAAIYTQGNTNRINTDTNIHALSGIRTHDPSVRANEYSSYLRPRGDCDRLFHFLLSY